MSKNKIPSWCCPICGGDVNNIRETIEGCGKCQYEQEHLRYIEKRKKFKKQKSDLTG